MKKDSIAIIPARGNSKGVPHKNIVKICGIPLIAYTINCAINSEVFDRIIVSTDDSKIAEISEKFGAGVIKRPARLAQDNTPMLPVLKHALKKLEDERCIPRFLYLLQPTSPLRNVEEIKQIAQMMETGKYSGIVSVVEYNYKAPLTLGKNKELIFINKSDLAKRRQDFGKIFKVSGAVYAFKTNFLLKLKKHLFEKKIFGFVASELTSLDIDTKDDLKIAEAVIRLKKSTK